MHYSLRLLTDFQCLKYTSSIAFYPTPIYLVLSLLSFFAITHTELAINPCITVQRLVANMRRERVLEWSNGFKVTLFPFHLFTYRWEKRGRESRFEHHEVIKLPFPALLRPVNSPASVSPTEIRPMAVRWIMWLKHTVLGFRRAASRVSIWAAAKYSAVEPWKRPLVEKQSWKLFSSPREKLRSERDGARRPVDPVAYASIRIDPNPPVSIWIIRIDPNQSVSISIN